MSKFLKFSCFILLITLTIAAKANINIYYQNAGHTHHVVVGEGITLTGLTHAIPGFIHRIGPVDSWNLLNHPRFPEIMLARHIHNDDLMALTASELRQEYNLGTEASPYTLAVHSLPDFGL